MLHYLQKPNRTVLGPVRLDNEIPTENLISKLKDASEWKVQTKAAELLAQKREKMVPDALLSAACGSPRLDVVKAALASFESVTGYQGSDVFDCEAARQWWEENQQQISIRLN